MATLTPNGDTEVITREPGNITIEKTVTMGVTGSQTISLSPAAGKKWIVKIVQSDCNIAPTAHFIQIGDGTESIRLTLDSTNASVLYVADSVLELGENDQLACRFNYGASTSNHTFRLLVVEFDA